MFWWIVIYLAGVIASILYGYDTHKRMAQRYWYPGRKGVMDPGDWPITVMLSLASWLFFFPTAAWRASNDYAVLPWAAPEHRLWDDWR